MSDCCSGCPMQMGTSADVMGKGCLRADIERLRAALHNIGIGGNGDRNWTLDEVRAVAWDALEPKP